MGAVREVTGYARNVWRATTRQVGGKETTNQRRMEISSCGLNRGVAVGRRMGEGGKGAYV